MSNIRDLGNKINSLGNMQKVMRAMNMIASIKLRKLYAVQSSLELFDD
ncbi:MAG: F0F1 ATP synthase subunit gamma, partial [Spirochaetaceae bacterium]|nr:F0F1 ATP synthase subunit gamma [Spirochaetaceae bacterium]